MTGLTAADDLGLASTERAVKRLFAKPIDLSFANGSLQVRDAAELEAALRGRVSPSPLRIAALGSLPADGRRLEAARAEDVERRIQQALVQPPGSLDGPAALLASLDLGAVTDDNDWRDILAAVRAVQPPHEGIAKATLTLFASYLASTRELLKAIEATPWPAAMPARVLPESETAEDLGRRQCLQFDLDELAGLPPPALRAPGTAAHHLPENPQFTRLPKGESIELELRAHQSVDLLLARYRFTLVAGSPFLLIDESGHDYRLQAGKNVLGRSTQCEVTLDAVFSAISRRHLVIEPLATEAVRFTDISSLGTFLPAQQLGPMSHGGPHGGLH